MAASTPRPRRKIVKWFAGALLGLLLSVLDQSQELFAGTGTFCGFISNGLACTVMLGAGLSALLELSFDFKHQEGESRARFLLVLWSQVISIGVSMFIWGSMKYRAASPAFDANDWTTLNYTSMIVSGTSLVAGFFAVLASERR